MNRSLLRTALLVAVSVPLFSCGDEGDTIVGPEWPPSGSIVLLGATNTLHVISASRPGTVLASVAVIGVDPGFTLMGIDFRPATRQLYAVGLSGANARLYAINVFNGTALLVRAPGVDFSTTLTTGNGFDFSPATDRIRVVGTNGENKRIDPNFGSVAGTDTDLSPAGYQVAAVAYSDNTVGATAATLYGIDFLGARLVRIGGVNGVPSPNGGVITEIGPLGVTPLVDLMGFDISPSGTAYASMIVGGLSRLYRVNLTTGAATDLGAIVSGAPVIRGLAVVP